MNRHANKTESGLRIIARRLASTSQVVTPLAKSQWRLYTAYAYQLFLAVLTLLTETRQIPRGSANSWMKRPGM